MSSKLFLQSLQNKLKGGNARSIHLNALPGRLATRFDISQLDIIEEELAETFLNTLLSKPSFEFKISFDGIDLNEATQDTQKKLGLIAKRLNSIIIENEDYYKEHGIKTLGFGYPILIKRSAKDPAKIIKAPLFIWPLEAVKSKTKVNEWSFLRNKTVQPNGKVTDVDIHSAGINEVLLSFIKGEDNITLPHLASEALEDAVVDETELINACAEVLHALNSGSKSDYGATLQKNFEQPVIALPEAAQIDAIANNKAYIHFGGVFGLFRAQKESIITDISRLLERFDEFEFDNLTVENLSATLFSAVDTDPSQQAIISALGTDANQIIQGPPGTGKSQSLTALITNALANGLKCLVVCEKKTALDVIKRNIERTNEQMGALVGVIDDVNDDREAIVDSVRDRQNGIPLLQSHQQVHNHYNTLKNALNESATLLNTQHKALAQAVYADKRWPQVVGRYLKLKKRYAEVPLKNVLNAADFSFHKDEKELETLIAILKRGENLHHQSRQVHAAFAPLADALFAGQTVGEARVKTEQFVAEALTRLPLLQQSIQQLQESGREWIDDFLAEIPEPIQQELKPYLPFCNGTNLAEKNLPAAFVHEEKTGRLLTELQALLSAAQRLRRQYEETLRRHYSSYYIDVTKGISDYLSFANDNIALYGSSFLNNSGGARFKAALLGIFSKKHKRLQQNRHELRTRISAVRQAHLQQPYIAHQYNDDADTTDLNIYINNIKELQQKAENWSNTYPAEIDAFLKTINETHFHTGFDALKQEAAALLRQFAALAGTAAADYSVRPLHSVSDINTLIQVIPGLTEQISHQHNRFKIFRQQYQSRADAYRAIKQRFEAIETGKGAGKVCDRLFTPYASLAEALGLCTAIEKAAVALKDNLHDFRVFHDWKSFFLALSQPQQKLVGLVSTALEDAWAEGFECWYLFWVLSLNEPPHLPKGDYELQQYKKEKEAFNKAQLNSIVARWIERQMDSVRAFKAKGQVVNSLFNKKGSKGMRRNSLRTIIRSEFGLFTDFFPVLLVSPSVCSSILPLEEGLFDLVIFDEASQLRLEDTYAALIRGKAKIVSGDKHQMAPSSYFEGSGALLDPFDDEAAETEEEAEDEGRNALQAAQLNLADSESLLAYAVDKGFKESYLNIHYRSKHPYLIDFSNHAFYGKRLIPVPAMQHYKPIEYIQVDGLYEGQVNGAEALKVVALLQQVVKPAKDGALPSVGVATFNIYQRNLILEEIGKVCQANAAFDSLMAQLGDAFFVKNLENIQGDERDIIIISTTFGRKTTGAFTQNFGPIIQGKGHRMLNVIITRAKHKVYICTSFPQEYVSQYPQLIQQKGNRGRGILYAYLTYAKAVSDGNDELRHGLLHLLSQYCSDRLYDTAEPGLGSESPFEDEVYERLAQHIGAGRITQQYHAGGFRIDMIIRHKDTNLPFLAIECDGAKYHSSPEAYAWDVFRQEQLERYGFVFYRIWSTRWWDAADRELEQLLDFIHKHDAAPIPASVPAVSTEDV